MVPSTLDEGGVTESRTEQAFVELVNPMALDVVEAHLIEKPVTVFNIDVLADCDAPLQRCLREPSVN